MGAFGRALAVAISARSGNDGDQIHFVAVRAGEIEQNVVSFRVGIGLLVVLIGVARAFREPQLYGGKILGSIFTVLAALLFPGSVWLFTHVRDVPRSAGAPQVGQRVPDFTLPDSTNQPVSIAALFSAAPGTAQPKALLLVFYRGYW
jgi:hypothetical protein